MQRRFRATVLAFVLAVVPAAALAQSVVVVPDRAVTFDDARDIAAAHGVDRIDSIERNSFHNQWEINGYDFANRYVEMDIDTNTGTVLRIER